MEKTKNTFTGLVIILISLLGYKFLIFTDQLSNYDAQLEFSMFDQVKSVFLETNTSLGVKYFQKNDDSKEDYVSLEKGIIGITVHFHQTDYVSFDGFLYPTDIDHRNYGGLALFIFIVLTGMLIFTCIVGISYIQGEQKILWNWLYKL